MVGFDLSSLEGVKGVCVGVFVCACVCWGRGGGEGTFMYDKRSELIFENTCIMIQINGCYCSFLIPVIL